MLEKDFKQIVENIKSEIYKTQTLIMSDANKRLIDLYYYVGKLVYEKSSWGNKFIENLSIAMKVEFPNIKGFTEARTASVGSAQCLECKHIMQTRTTKYL